jgi:putative membrane protein
MVKRLSDTDHQRVTDAIAAAEAGTSGEILAVAADQSDAYHDVGLHYAVAVLFLALAFFAWQPEWLSWWWDRMMGWAPAPTTRELLTLVLFVALLKFLAVLFIMKWMPLRLALTPGLTKTRRVRRRAIILFKTAAERRTVGRTGILIYLSMGERRAEIVGDEAITGRTNPETWADAMAALVRDTRDGRPGDGLVAAVAEVGRILAEDFPRAADDKNEIPDKLVEL